MNKKYSFKEIGIEGTYFLEDIQSIPLDALCIYEKKEKKLFTKSKEFRCCFSDEKEYDKGSYGLICLVHRTLDDREEQVLLKKPRISLINMTQEAVLQHLAYKTLETEGISWAVPKVLDVFRKEHEVCFSMEAIVGVNAEEYLSLPTSSEKEFFILLAQISLLLWCLESHLSLDHRDIKANNLLIKAEPCVMKVQIYEKVWHLISPFQVVILDFGFACIGSNGLRSRPLVNLGDGVLPPMDPCPKEGRDLFQLLTSLMSSRTIVAKLSSRILAKIDQWLSVGTKSYGSMARRWSSENWIYLVASQSDFALPSCCPSNILRDLLPELPGFLRVE
jgi:serine/threonine protein kinase